MKRILTLIVFSLLSFNTFAIEPIVYQCESSKDNILLQIERSTKDSDKDFIIENIVFNDTPFISTSITSEFVRLEALPDAASVYQVLVDQNNIKFEFELLDATRLGELFLRLKDEIIHCDQA